MIWIVLASGIFNIATALMVTTKNNPSTIFFKVIPFFLGIGCLIYSVNILL
jgi:hypothetical protein